MSRWRVTFWIDDKKPAELAVGQKVLDLKKKRQFARVVKEGIRLITSLREGDTSVLFELFPTLNSQLIHVKDIPPPPPPPDNSHLERQIAELKRLILEQGSIQAPPKDYPQLKGPALPPAPKAVIVDAKPMSADEIADNFMAFLQ